MIKTIVSQVPSGNKDIVAINNDYNCGQIIVDIKESEYTDTMKHELLGLLFRLYVKVDKDYVSFNGKTVLWNSGSDVSLPIYDIPQSSYILVEPIIDEVYLENNNLNPTEVFPITVHFNDEDISTHNNAEDVTNKIDIVDESGTDEQYPTASATYQYGQDISDELNAEIDRTEAILNEEIDATEAKLSKDLSNTETRINQEIDTVEENFSKELDQTEEEFDEKIQLTKAELLRLLSPHVIAEVPLGTEGLYACNKGVDEVEWQLTGFDLSPYRKLKFYIRSGGDASNNETCSEVVVMHLDKRSLNNVTGNCYLASSCTQHANSADRIFLNTFAVSEDKTKISFLRSTSITLFGIASDYSGKDRYCYLIEGYLI